MTKISHKIWVFAQEYLGVLCLGETCAFLYSIWDGLFEMGYYGLKAFVVAVMAAAGSLLTKWIVKKVFKNNGKV